MPSSKKSSDNDEKKSVQEVNFDNARKTAEINHQKHVDQNTVEGYEGVEVREAKPVEVINPVRNQATGELEDDTRTIKTTPEEEVGAADVSGKSGDDAKTDGSEKSKSEEK